MLLKVEGRIGKTEIYVWSSKQNNCWVNTVIQGYRDTEKLLTLSGKSCTDWLRARSRAGWVSIQSDAAFYSNTHARLVIYLKSIVI